ncbi:MAG: peptide-binding protein [Victivallales bacterium]|jgi:peptide/nickel transport system substrate-binding protein|nr:peptide-binding protein [Victivallales bacterium]
MDQRGYLKFILTVLVLVIAFFGHVLITAVDRVRDSNMRILEKLEALPGKIALVSRPADSSASVAHTTIPEQSKIANREFFDPKAEVGGRLIQATSADTANMNSLVNNDAAASEFNSLCNSSLAERNYEKPEEFQGLLAESWSISPDHLVYRIKLRKGVYWHDFTDPVTGKEHRNVEVTAADFKFYVDVVKNPDVNCEPMRGYLADLEEVKIIDDYEFEVRWNKPYYGSLMVTLGLSPMPRHLYWAYDGPFDGKRFNDDHIRNRMIVGCGAYMFVRWDKDRRVIFRRNPRYFGNRYGAAPALEYLVYEIIKHPNTRFQALLSGDLDRLALTPDQWMQRTDSEPFRDGTLKRYKYLSFSYSYIGWNLRNPLFADAKVRRALTMLIDREKIRRDIYFGLAETVTGPFSPTGIYADPTIKPYPYDPIAAKKLLAEAGWKDEDGDGILEKSGKKFTFTMLQVASSTTQQRMMPIIKETLAAAGVDMKIQNVEWSVYVQRLEEQTFEACCLAWTSPPDPDPYQVWHSSQAGIRGSSNHIGFKNAQVDQFIEELRRTFDPKRRVELAHRFCQILHEQQPYTFLFAPYNLLAQSGRYKNVRIFPLGMPESLFWVPTLNQHSVPNL